MGYSPWGCKESDMTEQLNNNKNSLTLATDLVGTRFVEMKAFALL